MTGMAGRIYRVIVTAKPKWDHVMKRVALEHERVKKKACWFDLLCRIDLRERTLGKDYVGAFTWTEPVIYDVRAENGRWILDLGVRGVRHYEGQAAASRSPALEEFFGTFCDEVLAVSMTEDCDFLEHGENVCGKELNPLPFRYDKGKTLCLSMGGDHMETIPFRDGTDPIFHTFSFRPSKAGEYLARLENTRALYQETMKEKEYLTLLALDWLDALCRKDIANELKNCPYLIMPQKPDDQAQNRKQVVGPSGVLPADSFSKRLMNRFLIVDSWDGFDLSLRYLSLTERQMDQLTDQLLQNISVNHVVSKKAVVRETL